MNESLVQESALQADEIASYRRDGYVVPEFRFPDEIVAQFTAELDNMIARNLDDGLQRVHGPHTLDIGGQFFHDLARRDDLLDMVEALIGPDICLYGSHMYLKPWGGGREFGWHRDCVGLPIVPVATVTAWIAIEDSDQANGCMRVRPGSHLDDSAQDSVPVELKAGQVSFHDANLIHGSDWNNHANRRRPGLALRFMPTTSHWNRDLPSPWRNDPRPWIDVRTRPIYLVRGVDRCGLNDYRMGK